MKRRIYVEVEPDPSSAESAEDCYDRILGGLKEFVEDIFPDDKIKVLSDTEEKTQ